MKINVTLSMFIQAFKETGAAANFTVEGLTVLFEYITELEENGIEEFELDVPGLCESYEESALFEINRDYALGSDLDNPEARADIENWLCDKTVVVGATDNGFVYAKF